MGKLSQISISGKVAEKFDDETRSYVRIVCHSNKIMIDLDNIDNISLGDIVTLTGELEVTSVLVNGNITDKKTI